MGTAAYSDLDAAIVCFIEANPSRHPIYSDALILMAAAELGRDREHGDDKEWRLIERRLQALRKIGRIKHERATRNGPGGWRIVGA